MLPAEPVDKSHTLVVRILFDGAQLCQSPFRHFILQVA